MKQEVCNKKKIFASKFSLKNVLPWENFDLEHLKESTIT